MQVCKLDLAHSYVNVRHKLYKRGIGAPMGGTLSAFYAILCFSRREATAFTPLLGGPSSPYAVCRYMDDEYVSIAYTNRDQLMQATKVVHFIAAEGTGYPPPLVLSLEPEGTQRFLETSRRGWLVPSRSCSSRSISQATDSPVYVVHLSTT